MLFLRLKVILNFSCFLLKIVSGFALELRLTEICFFGHNAREFGVMCWFVQILLESASSYIEID